MYKVDLSFFGSFFDSRVAQRGGGLNSSAARSEHEVSEIIDGISEHEVSFSLTASSAQPGFLSWSWLNFKSINLGLRWLLEASWSTIVGLNSFSYSSQLRVQS